MRHFVTCVALIATTLGSSSSAAADPLQIRVGGLFLDFEGHILGVAGDGFSVQHAPDPTNLGLFIASVPNPDFCFGCDAGAVLNMSFTTPGETYLGIGNATVNGNTYTGVTLRGSLDFQAHTLTFPVGFPDATFFPAIAPFTFAGAIRGFSGDTEMFSLDLFGNGHVRTDYYSVGNRFVSEAGAEGLYRFEDVAATPEPSTLLLMGLGLAAAGARRRRLARIRSRACAE